MVNRSGPTVGSAAPIPEHGQKRLLVNGPEVPREHGVIVVTAVDATSGDRGSMILRTIGQCRAALMPSLRNPEVEKTGLELRHFFRSVQCDQIYDTRSFLDLKLASALVSHHAPKLCSEIQGFEVPQDDSRAIAEIKHLRRRTIEALVDSEQLRAFEEVEAPLIPVLCAMEQEGIRCDKVQLLESEKSITAAIRDVTEKIQREAQTAINLDRTQDVGVLLYEQLQLCPDPPRTRAGNYATDEETLRSLPTQHPIVYQVLEYRRLTTLKRGYLNILPEAIDPATQRIYTTYEQIEAANGRLVSRNPNLQNIPIRTAAGREIRRAFLPRDDDYLLLSADFSQLELRLLAHFSGDETLLAAFKSGIDVHSATAERLFDVPAGNVTEQMRSVAKTINYGVAYGMTSFGLARKLGRPLNEAQSIIDDYFSTLSGLGRYATDIVNEAKSKGFVSTLMGRRRYIPEIKAKAFHARKRAERIAISSPIQGTAADLIKLAMVGIHHEIHRRKLKSRMLLQVHDELVFDLFKPERQEIAALVTEKMCSTLDLNVPLEVNIAIGPNWLDLS